MCVDCGSRGNDMGAGGRYLSPRVVVVRWRGPARIWADMRGRCAGGRVSGLHGAFRLCGVEYAWTLGLVRSQVALSGLLLWPQYRALGCHCVGRGWVPKMFLTIRRLRMARS